MTTPKDDAPIPSEVEGFLKAAEQGDAAAQNNLGNAYWGEGRGVSQNDMNAYMWFTLAASSGYKDTSTNRDLVAEKMSPKEIAEAQHLAREWDAAHPRDP